MKNIYEIGIKKQKRPVRIVQFGEGNFLRAFVDYMIDILNEKTGFDGSIAIVKPISFGSLDKFEKQDCLYTVVLRGREKGKTVNRYRVITSVDRAVDGAETWENLAKLARCETVRFIVSNTTEAGIVLDETDKAEGIPNTYPGKLTKFLYERFNFFDSSTDRGVIVLPVELIEDNGKKLLDCVLRLSKVWDLPENFRSWVTESCVFCSTLVDRIVTGYPAGESSDICSSLGYNDELLDVGEPFGLWVIESGRDISAELPFDKAGLPVIFTSDQRPYRERKVRILNGAHTSSVLISWLCGLGNVREMMLDDDTGHFVRRVVLDEIAPHVPLDRDSVVSFANDVFERFENPFIDHRLLSISLNSVSKWKARVLPTFRDYYRVNGALPPVITFSFAALLAFYSSSDLREDGLRAARRDGTEYTVRDDRNVLEFFVKKSVLDVDRFVAAAAANTGFWGEDLSLYAGFVPTVAGYLSGIRNDPRNALRKILTSPEK